VFKHIDRLVEIAEASAAGAAHHYERAIRDGICNKCCTAPTAGDYCSEGLHSTCPLSRFAGQAVAVLQALVEAEARVAAHANGGPPELPCPIPAASRGASDDPLRWKGVLP
jgi:hypothetical protein